MQAALIGGVNNYATRHAVDADSGSYKPHYSEGIVVKATAHADAYTTSKHTNTAQHGNHKAI